MTIFATTIILFLIIDPLGNLVSFNTMLDRVKSDRRQMVFLREMGIALIAMLTFYYLGEVFFNILQVNETTVYFASGLILFLFGIKILFPSISHPRSNLPKEEPFIIPLAIPLIASPSLLATIMLFARQDKTNYVVISGILISWALATFIMFFAKQLQKILGPNGVSAVERLMGMLLVMLAIQRFLEGIQLFIANR